MKKVLIADSHPLFRDFLKQKFMEEQIQNKEKTSFFKKHKDLIFEILDRCCPLIFSIQEYPIITEALSRVSNKSIILNNRFSKKQRIALWLLKNGWGQVLYSIVPTNK